MARLAVGVVGAGGIATREHLPSFEAHPDTELVAVCDPDETRLESAADDWDVDGAFRSLEEMLRETDLDVVDICSPPQFHREQAVAAFEDGADVLMEKPMVESVEEADELREAQLETGRKFTMIHNRKFRESVARPIELVEEGTLGNVHTIDVNRFVDGDREEKIHDPGRWEHGLKGGRWAEILPHHVYQPYHFVEDLRLLSVNSMSLNEAYRPHLIADEVSIHLAHASGYVRIRYTANNDGKNREMVIHGAEGKIVTDAASTARMRLFGSDWTDLAAGTERTKSSHARQIDQFVDYVLGDAPNPVSWEEAYTTLRIVDAINGELQAQYDERAA